ncbi:hypothetical protein [Streptomyces anandii]|uniref:hypothetical protein n=1 Tax=Streptomyces anandii TaxID=285454 RepID=UPI000ADECE98|nr:hypothetical protein [Streptomyces anandii]GGX94778.1 hypothetical protein GCM10010510_45060 [Streptomyces anandii JCM 4720]
MARDRSGRKNRIAYNQQVAGWDTSQIVGAAVFFGLFAGGLAGPTHNYSWAVFAVLLTAGWAWDARVHNRVVFAWNRRVAADSAVGISGAPTPAYCRDAKFSDGTVLGLAVPIHTGGFHFFAESGSSNQFPPVEIVKINRSLPYHRIEITTTSTVWPTIVVEPQNWNIKAWELLKDRETYQADQ